MLDRSQKILLAYHVLTVGLQKVRKRVIEQEISPAVFFSLTSAQLLSLGVPKELLDLISDPHKVADRELSLANERKVKILFKSSPSFPSALLQIYDPPECLYVLGDESILCGRMLGVVGARRHSSYGTRVMEQYFGALVSAQITIVSGMAYGIDSLAHRLTLAHQGKTVGVNAGGLLHLYPPGNRNLIGNIIRSGCVVSEFPLDTIPRPFHFPIRNRIIAGISEKLWVVEAAERSGSLITARLALETGREVLATPGSVDCQTSVGTNRLIRDGATPILCETDILEEFGLKPEKNSATYSIQDLSADEKSLLDLLRGNGVKDIDNFVEKLQIPVQRVISALNGLALLGLVAEFPGGNWHLK